MQLILVMGTIEVHDPVDQALAIHADDLVTLVDMVSVALSDPIDECDPNPSITALLQLAPVRDLVKHAAAP